MLAGVRHLDSALTTAGSVEHGRALAHRPAAQDGATPATADCSLRYGDGTREKDRSPNTKSSGVDDHRALRPSGSAIRSSNFRDQDIRAGYSATCPRCRMRSQEIASPPSSMPRLFDRQWARQPWRKYMKNLFVAVVFAGTVASFSAATAADGCGPGCHATPSGACIVDGWGTGGVSVWNECPAGARPRPPCGYGYVWRPRSRACFALN